mmetsp:Transcript_3454/g.5765  ORF Transcript_3454/g.5765 Transcript_3454/m.5765 type:complete len:301 (+) Transcript_3454:2078-2980(+)
MHRRSRGEKGQITAQAADVRVIGVFVEALQLHSDAHESAVRRGEAERDSGLVAKCDGDRHLPVEHGGSAASDNGDIQGMRNADGNLVFLEVSELHIRAGEAGRHGELGAELEGVFGERGLEAFCNGKRQGFRHFQGLVGEHLVPHGPAAELLLHHQQRVSLHGHDQRGGWRGHAANVAQDETRHFYLLSRLEDARRGVEWSDRGQLELVHRGIFFNFSGLCVHHIDDQVACDAVLASLAVTTIHSRDSVGSVLSAGIGVMSLSIVARVRPASPTALTTGATQTEVALGAALGLLVRQDAQ